MSSAIAFPLNPSLTFPSDYIPPCEEEPTLPDSKIFDDISILRLLGSAKFPVYLIASRVNGTLFATKVFSPNVDKYLDFYQNETRFSCLRHPNIIKIVHFEEAKPPLTGDPSFPEIPYTIMEYAPHGDFFDFLKNHKHQIDDRLIRTYFRQLIDGMEYLHIKGIAHMDLKLENLLIGDDFSLKITDFDISYVMGDEKVYSKGTKNYRAPEVIEGTCRNFWAADMYSVGVILFILKTHGVFPYLEDRTIMGHDFRELIFSHNEFFWKKHAEIIEKKPSYFDDDFRTLFNGLMRINSQSRFTINDVKKSNWYNGPVYSKKELLEKGKKIFEC